MIEKKEACCVRCIHVTVCSHVEDLKTLCEQVKIINHAALFSITVSCSEQKHYGGIPRDAMCEGGKAARGTTYETFLKRGIE